MTRHLLTAAVVVLFSTSALAQFNVKAGYRLGFVNPEAFNRIIDDHNAIQNDTTSLYPYTRSFKHLTYMHRADLGLRYGMESVAFEFGWIFSRKQLLADGIGENNKFENSITTTINAATLSE